MDVGVYKFSTIRFKSGDSIKALHWRNGVEYIPHGLEANIDLGGRAGGKSELPIVAT